MQSFDDLAGNMLAVFDSKNEAREKAFSLSRASIRSCSQAIRSVHRGEIHKSAEHLGEARKSLDEIFIALKDHPSIRYSGFVDDAEQEYAEAKNVYSIITEQRVLTPEETRVDLVNYLTGLGDVTGEMRRHILDLIREGKSAEAEYFLRTMEEIFYLLMLFDYPEAITRGLRRKSDLARSMLERTRGDLTNAIEMGKMAESIGGLEDKLKSRGSDSRI